MGFSKRQADENKVFFEFFEEDLEPLFTKRFTFLLDFNFLTIEKTCQCLGITMPTEKTESYIEKYVDLTDNRMLVNAKKEANFGYKRYSQAFQDRHGFIENLSILDLLFNEGNSAISYLEDIKIDFSGV